MTSQHGKQTIARDILSNISQSKGNQTMKLGQLKGYNKRYIFLWKICRKRGGETSSRPPLVFLKSFVLGKSKWSAAWFHYVSIALKLAYNRKKLFKTLHYRSRDILNFDFLDKVSPAHFVYDFSTKIFLMLYSVNWPNFWLPLLFKILGNMCIAIVYYPSCDVLNFEINFIFLIEPFFYMTEKSWQKLKYLENEKSF